MTHREKMIAFFTAIQTQIDASYKGRRQRPKVYIHLNKIILFVKQPYRLSRKDTMSKIERLIQRALKRPMTQDERSELKLLLDEPDWKLGWNAYLDERNHRDARKGREMVQKIDKKYNIVKIPRP